nr:hypothetical protein GCM10025732_34360 [Glycomyces mayteni]
MPVIYRRAPRPVEIVAMTAGVGALTALSLLSQPSLGPLEYAVAVLAWASAVVQVWRPVGGALAATVLAVLSPMATTAATVGALQTAWRTRFRTAVAVSLAGIGAHLLQWVWHPNAALDFKWWALLVAAVYGALLGWGTLARSHRDLVISLRERARRAEAEQGRRVAEARAAERRGLAREMHDVLANRLSLVATHAGALEFRPDAPPEKIALAAGVVRDGVHQALEELREVIGLLREDEGVSGCSRRWRTWTGCSRTRGGRAGRGGRRRPRRRGASGHGGAHGLPGGPGGVDERAQARGRAAGRGVARGRSGRGAGDRGRQPAAGGGDRSGGARERPGPGGADRAGAAGGRIARPRGDGREVRAAGPATMADVIRVLLVDDDALVRAGLSMMLDGVGDIRVVGEAGDGREALTAFEAHSPTWSSWTSRCRTSAASRPRSGCASGRTRRKWWC